ncbi:GyrI-like domain-containing protein [Serinibacter salmoneus]|uniref:DNA gyrase inhibitor GyrI n=1 Tax=Serinibacter salmoneus TaxID=556530 RepID=A0A2A9D0L5_9MICO|nr:GyrI-like domain-containing protein [Serinibacter salmoneus]PFG19931.1 DNA gyrase inhibitor GyrI [Serinibacter salmoneus]
MTGEETLPIPAEPRTGTEMLELGAIPIASVRHDGQTTDGLRELYDATLGAVGQAIAQGLITPSAAPFGLFHGDPMATFDLEIGIPVAERLEEPIEVAGVRISPSVIDPGPFAARSHVGSYDSLGRSWMALVQDATTSGAAPGGRWLEVYVDDPREAPEESLRTELFMSIARP